MAVVVLRTGELEPNIEKIGKILTVTTLGEC